MKLQDMDINKRRLLIGQVALKLKEGKDLWHIAGDLRRPLELIQEAASIIEHAEAIKKEMES